MCGIAGVKRFGDKSITEAELSTLLCSIENRGNHATGIRSAIMMYEYIASRLGSIIIPTSPQGKLAALILSAVGRNGLTEEEITFALKSQASQWDIDKMLDSLIFSGAITIRGDKFLTP